MAAPIVTNALFCGPKGPQARALVEKTCKAGNMLACNHHGQLYQNGLGCAQRYGLR